ncbi:sugar phosphate isomerase/epimerase family protein [Microbacterium azadirachtae]|uniref:Inosose dehydratase n=1 Tax=Microbacterium azadirachtae TaxID=582680 RepID=A0A0F0LS93_9MICO|nr:TIM barrel protein [Microbacterium azadirachtae]KJL35150.1 Inosose dehydratase [Microbacterium azadirachtae]
MIPLAYGTYGLRDLSPWDAIDAIAAAGYDGVELTLAEGYRNAAPRLSSDESSKIRERLDATGVDLVGVLAKLHVLGAEGALATAARDDLLEIIGSGLSLSPRNPLIVTFTMGGRSAEWPAGRAELADALGALGATAASEGVLLAVEAHVGGLIDRPERVHWLIDQVGLESVRINFDISHFTLPGLQYDTNELIEELAPLAVHAHVKDSVPTAAGFQFVLPGDGLFDYPQYFAGMMAAGWNRPVTVEVSAMVFGQPDYEPVRAIESSYRALSRARSIAQQNFISKNGATR